MKRFWKFIDRLTDILPSTATKSRITLIDIMILLMLILVFFADRSRIQSLERQNSALRTLINSDIKNDPKKLDNEPKGYGCDGTEEQYY